MSTRTVQIVSNGGRVCGGLTGYAYANKAIRRGRAFTGELDSKIGTAIVAGGRGR